MPAKKMFPPAAVSTLLGNDYDEAKLRISCSFLTMWNGWE